MYINGKRCNGNAAQDSCSTCVQSNNEHMLSNGILRALIFMSTFA